MPDPKQKRGNLQPSYIDKEVYKSNKTEDYKASRFYIVTAVLGIARLGAYKHSEKMQTQFMRAKWRASQR